MPRTRTTLAEDLAPPRAPPVPALRRAGGAAGRAASGIRRRRRRCRAGTWATSPCTSAWRAPPTPPRWHGELDVAHCGTIVPEHPDLAQRVAVLNADHARQGPARRLPRGPRPDPRRRRRPGRGGGGPRPRRAVPHPVVRGRRAADRWPRSSASSSSETALHGLDLARATGQKWEVPPAIARLVISLAYLDTIPRTVDAARAASRARRRCASTSAAASPIGRRHRRPAGRDAPRPRARPHRLPHLGRPGGLPPHRERPQLAAPPDRRRPHALLGRKRGWLDDRADLRAPLRFTARRSPGLQPPRPHALMIQ